MDGKRIKSLFLDHNTATQESVLICPGLKTEEKERRRKRKRIKRGKRVEGEISTYRLYRYSYFLFLFFAICLDVFIS